MKKRRKQPTERKLLLRPQATEEKPPPPTVEKKVELLAVEVAKVAIDEDSTFGRFQKAADSLLPNFGFSSEPLVDIHWKLNEHILPKLSGLPLNYLTVGWIGTNESKSRILNHLSKSSPQLPSPFQINETSLVDVFISPERVVYLNSFNLFSLKAAKTHAAQGAISKRMSYELYAAYQSLLHSVLMLSVCNLIIVPAKERDITMITTLFRQIEEVRKLVYLPQPQSQEAQKSYAAACCLTLDSSNESVPLSEEWASVCPNPVNLLPEEDLNVAFIRTSDSDKLESMRHQILSFPRSELQKSFPNERDWLRFFWKVCSACQHTDVLVELSKPLIKFVR